MLDFEKLTAAQKKSLEAAYKKEAMAQAKAVVYEIAEKDGDRIARKFFKVHAEDFEAEMVKQFKKEVPVIVNKLIKSFVRDML